ncbi:MAG TPA: HAD family hydrolase [Thermomicrobiales bacterium]|nr:HAD family hydrolase [Thermomicrobiales bacterium]
MSQPAILLDRDGVINVNRPDHVKSWNEFRFVPGALTALAALSRLRLPMVVISNQAVVQRGIISEAELDAIHQRMMDAIQRAGARLDRIFYCPHDQSEGCGCRKPEPGMILEAASELDLDLSRSVFVGDACTDIQAGERARCKTVLVLTGRGHESMQVIENNPSIVPHAVAADLLRAVPIVRGLLDNRIPTSSAFTSDTMPVAISAAMD